MHICPGKAQMVAAIDDGGLSMSFQREKSSQESCRVVLSVKVPQFHPLPANFSGRNTIKPGNKNDETTTNRHGAQIFAEMLGQVCHPQFYHDLDNEYQEVNLHIAVPMPITSVYIFITLSDAG